MKERYIYKIYRVIGLFLFVWSIISVVYYLYAAIQLHHFPTYNNPDPEKIDNVILTSIGNFIVLSYLLSMYCSMIFLGLLVFHLIYNWIGRIKTNFKSILLSSIGLILFIAIQILPGARDIMDWLLD
jgi:hypothetical protein